MSALSDRPSFSKGEIDLERRRIALIDKLLAENGAMKIDALFRIIRTNDSTLFDTLPALKGFIQSRTNIFQTDQALSTEIRNRSMEYREAMVYIVDKLANTPIQRKINFISAELGSHFPIVKRWEVGSGDAAAYKFVSEHKSIFAFVGPTPIRPDQRLVDLHPLSRTIPSVWVKETLPEYDTTKWRRDRSITISGTACVAHSVKGSNYLKLQIVDDSPYAGDTVYIIGQNVGFMNSNLIERFPLQSLVSFTAIKAYFAAQPWTATSIKEASKEGSVELEQRHIIPSVKLLSPAPNNNQVKKTIVNSPPASAAENIPVLTELDEKYLVGLIDSIVGGERLLIRSLWTRLQKKYDIASFVKDEIVLEQFLSNRPHLFFVNEGSVMLRSVSHRRVLSYLIESMKSGVKYTLNSIGARIGSYDAEFKRDVYGSGNAWIHKFVDDHRTLLEIVGPYSPDKPLGQSVQLRRTSPVARMVRSVSSSPISPSLSASSIAISDPTPSVIHGCGVIKKLNQTSGYLMIEGGEHSGDTVYFAASELKENCCGSGEVGIGDHLNFDATNSPNKGMAHQWRATRLSLAVRKAASSSTYLNKERPLGSSNAVQNQEAIGGKESTEIKLKTTSTNNLSTATQRPSREAIVQMETSRKAMTDNYLEYGPLCVDTLFEKFALTQQDLFSYHYQMIEFLCIRSHLYAVDFDAKSVSRRHMDYRRALSRLLICCCQRADCSVEDLRQLALQSSDDTYAPIVDRCASKLAFENFLKEHEQLFEMTEVIDDKENRMVQARGTYDTTHDIFLPRYYHLHS
uniref:RGS domain-containing protein n=1 Tax=Plectus sambesii TaxID=2011161 RepID=A0A914WX02_9BILA